MYEFTVLDEVVSELNVNKLSCNSTISIVSIAFSIVLIADPCKASKVHIDLLLIREHLFCER